jgi:hypothetical protein
MACSTSLARKLGMKGLVACYCFHAKSLPSSLYGLLAKN